MNPHNVLRLRKKMTEDARSTAPVKTGNLKFNAIYSMKTSKGFKIVWDKYFAYYIEMQDKVYHKQFVDMGIAKALSNLQDDKIIKTMSKKKDLKNPYTYLKSSLQLAVQKSIKNKKYYNFSKGEAMMKAKFEESIKYAKQHMPEENRDNVLRMYNPNNRIQDVYEYKEY